MDFRIVLSDRQFNILEFWDNQVSAFQFAYTRLGGCGNFSVTLPRDYCNEGYISGDFNIKIYMKNPVPAGTFMLWYQGLVATKTPTVAGNRESIDVDGYGYVNQLSNVYLNSLLFNHIDVAAAATYILTNYIVGVKDINLVPANVPLTGFLIDTITFNTDCFSALQQLAQIGGNIEWGVDAFRNFFFMPASLTSSFLFNLGANVENFKEQQDFTAIVNRVIIQGGQYLAADGSSQTYTSTWNDNLSQLKYGRRDQVQQSSYITTDAVAAALASSIFADYNDVVRKASCDLTDYKKRLEATLPVPLVTLKASAITYGTKQYGTFLYSGLVNRQINQITYNIDINKNLEISLDMGQYLPNQADMLQQIEYNVEQLRIASL